MGQQPLLTTQKRRDLLIVCALCAVCFFWRLGTPGLFDFNEGLYVEAAREMVIRGDYITGRVNGVPFYDKPPLALWCTAAAFTLFGVNEWAARLPVALASSLTVLATFWLGSRWSRRTGLLAAAFLSLNFIVLGTSRQMTMDMHQTWWVTAAMVSAVLGLRKDNRRAGWYWAAFWLSCGLGFMAKSFPGLLPIPILVVYLAWRHRHSFRQMLHAGLQTRPLLGIGLLALVIVPWHLAAYFSAGRLFVQEYWLLHHVGLIRGDQFGHVHPIWYYVPVLLGAYFPWSFLLPVAAGEIWRHGEDEVLQLLVTWALVTFVLFSLVQSKLVSYLLPMFPAMAVLTAFGVDRAIVRWEHERGKSNRSLAVSLTAAAIVQIVVSSAAFYWLIHRAPHVTDPEAVQLLTQGMIQFARLALGILALGLSAAATFSWIRPREGVGIAAVTVLAFTLVTWELGIPAYDRAVGEPLRSIVAAAAQADSNASPLIVHVGRPRRPSIFFYLPARLFAGPLPQDPRQGFLLESSEPQAVLKEVARHEHAYVLADARQGIQTLKGAGDIRITQRSGRWALFSVHPGNAE